MNYKEITTLAAVFAALNLAPEVKPDVSVWPERYREHKTHEYNLQMAIDAVNGPDWVADWNNTDQPKYTIIWEIVENTERASGRGLAFGAVVFDDSAAFVGPRLVFRSREHADHFAKYFRVLFESYYLG